MTKNLSTDDVLDLVDIIFRDEQLIPLFKQHTVTVLAHFLKTMYFQCDYSRVLQPMCVRQHTCFGMFRLR